MLNTSYNDIHSGRSGHFYKSHNAHSIFANVLDSIKKWRSVNYAIRNYARAWQDFLEGEMGGLRVQSHQSEGDTRPQGR
jgi:hypothetical protein